jgi:Protein of unknown function (DUF4239)
LGRKTIIALRWLSRFPGGVIMSSIAVSSIVFASVFGGAMLGVFLRSALPPQHLSADSKDIVRLGMGLVGTMAALVLGLLVASAKSSYDAQSNELTQVSANIIQLDHVLARYGPEAKEVRDQLRGAVVGVVERVWPRDHSRPSVLQPSSATESLYDRIQQLSPKDNVQRSLQAEALSMASSVSQTRWLMYEQTSGSVPMPMLVILVLWLAIIFLSFGLFAPRNATVVASLFISALSVSCAILLILEMYKPFEGLIQISGAPLYAALARLGQ